MVYKCPPPHIFFIEETYFLSSFVVYYNPIKMKLRTSHHVVSPDEFIKTAVDPEGFEVIFINEAIGM